MALSVGRYKSKPLSCLMSIRRSPLFALGGTCMLGPNPMMRRRISEGLHICASFSEMGCSAALRGCNMQLLEGRRAGCARARACVYFLICIYMYIAKLDRLIPLAMAAEFACPGEQV